MGRTGAMARGALALLREGSPRRGCSTKQLTPPSTAHATSAAQLDAQALYLGEATGRAALGFSSYSPNPYGSIASISGSRVCSRALATARRRRVQLQESAKGVLAFGGYVFCKVYEMHNSGYCMR